MSKNKLLENLSIDNKYEMRFKKCCRGSLCVKRLSLSREQDDNTKNSLNFKEIEMFRQILNAQDVGSCMLVVTGLRSLVESLVNYVCTNEKIPIERADENGKVEKIPLKEKCLSIKEYFKDKKNNQLFIEIIDDANDIMHKLKSTLQRKSSEEYVYHFINTIGSEKIFIKKNLQLMFVSNWIKENADLPSKEHWMKTGFWLKKICTNPSEAMMIAAIGHDIERNFPKEKGEKEPENLDWDNKKYLLWHGERSAKFIEILLSENCAEKDLIREVVDLVKHHELGGNAKENFIKDADSISFLENNWLRFIQKYPKKRAEKKFNFMFNRITSEKARQLAEPFYKKAIEKLNSI